MGCKYVKDFTFDSAAGYSGSAGKKEVKTYMRGGAVNKAPLDASVPKQTPVNMRPLRTANAKTAMGEANAKRVSGASGKVSTAGQYAKGGMACGSEMKKGGKAKSSSAKKSSSKKPTRRASKVSKAEDKMVEQVLQQMIAQTAQTGRVPGVPPQEAMMDPMMQQGRPMPAPNARAVPPSPQSPLIGMMMGGKVRK
jgi:hypothetical protein